MDYRSNEQGCQSCQGCSDCKTTLSGYDAAKDYADPSDLSQMIDDSTDKSWNH